MGCIFITYNPAAEWEEPRGGHTITHNDIYRSGRALIHFSSDQLNHGDEQTVYEAMDIGYNRLHDACLNANDGGAFNSWKTTLGSGSSRTQIHHNLVYDLWSYFWNSLVYPDNNTFNLDIHHNMIWHSSNANVWQAHSFNYFYHHNPPGDPNYAESNVEKINYDGSIGIEIIRLSWRIF